MRHPVRPNISHLFCSRPAYFERQGRFRLPAVGSRCFFDPEPAPC
jgi:hypothetical protein